MSVYLAKKTFDKIRVEKGDLTYSEQYNQDKLESTQWLLNYQNEINRSDKSVKDIAAEFNKSSGQILRARAKLRTLLNKSKVKEANNKWLIENKNILLNSDLSNQSIASMLDLTSEQLTRKKGH